MVFPGCGVVVKGDSHMIDGKTMAKVITFMAKTVPGGVSPDHQVMLFLDGHDSRLSVEALTEALRLGVHIRLLMPNTTHFLQPWDQMFGAIKAHYSRYVCNVPFVTDGQLNLSRAQWIGLCAWAIKTYTETTPDCMQRAFAKTGLWPLDVEVAVNAMRERVAPSSAAAKRTAARAQLQSSCIELNARKRVRVLQEPCVAEALKGVALMQFRLKEVMTTQDRAARGLPKHRVAAAAHCVITHPDYIVQLAEIKRKKPAKKAAKKSAKKAESSDDEADENQSAAANSAPRPATQRRRASSGR